MRFRHGPRSSSQILRCQTIGGFIHQIPGEVDSIGNELTSRGGCADLGHLLSLPEKKRELLDGLAILFLLLIPVECIQAKESPFGDGLCRLFNSETPHPCPMEDRPYPPTPMAAKDPQCFPADSAD